MNTVILLGNLTRAAELKDVGSTQLTNITLAVRNPYNKDTTDFIDCTAFGKQAEIIATYTGKGSRLLVNGRLQVRNFQDKEGNKRSKTEVLIGQVTLLDSKPKDDTVQPFHEDTEQLPF